MVGEMVYEDVVYGGVMMGWVDRVNARMSAENDLVHCTHAMVFQSVIR